MKKTSSRGILAAVTTSAAMIASVCAAGNGNGNGNGNSSTTTTTTTTTETTEPASPRGGIVAAQSMVREGELAKLTWEIAYPQTLKQIATVETDGSVTPKTDLELEVRVVGASYQITDNKGKVTWGTVEAAISLTNATFKSNNGHGNNIDGVDVSNPGQGGGGPTGAEDPSGSVDDERIFNGKQTAISPTQVLFPKSGKCIVKEGSKVNFKARCYNGSQWLSWRETGKSSKNVVALVNGDTPPTTTPAFSQGKIETFLQPYMENGKIKIGPKDVIYLIELGQTDPKNSGFDLQDMVILCTYKSI